jgi:RHS repeat-associated protein
MTTTEFTYDGAGRLVQVKNPKNQLSNWQYNSRGLVTEKTTVDAGTVKYKYDHAGRLRYWQDAKQAGSGRVGFRTYDFLGRQLIEGEAPATFSSLDPDATTPPAFETLAGSQHWLLVHKYDYKADETAEYPYIQVLGQFPDPGEITNLFGRTSAVASKSGNIWQVELFSYDVHGRIIKKWVLTENASTIDTRYLYTYDRQGNMITRHDRIGNSPYYNFSYYHWYDYDVLGHLASVYSGDASSKPTIPDVTYTYTPAGGKASEEFRGNLNQAFTYDLRGRLTAIGDVTNTGRPFGASYSWSGAENITSAEFSQSGTPHAHKRYRYSFDYDNLNRLTSAQYAWFSGGTFTGSSAWQLESVAYDAAGNITSLKRRNQGGTLWHHYSLQYPAGNNRLTSYQNHAPGFQDLYSLQYDANGNVTHIENADYTLWVDITWDPYNRMTTYQETNNGITTWYRYNASGSRYYKKTGAAAPVYTIRDGLAAVAVLGTGTSFTIRKPDGEVIGFKPYNTIKSWYLKDHLGSTRTRVGENGAVQEVLDYYPFGLEMPGRGMVTGAATPWRFTGYERDPESFLDYAQARYYHPGIGQFWSVDPHYFNYPGISPYVYVGNNPLKFIDPDGRDIWEINRQGHIIRHIEDDTQDAFYIVNEDGDRIEGQSIHFKYGTIGAVDKGLGVDEEGNSIAYSFMSIDGDDIARQLFEFFAHNTGVEWSQVQFGRSGNFVSTSHRATSEVGGADLMRKHYNDFYFRSHIHSHPTSTTGPSGFHPLHPPGMDGDKRFAEWANTYFPRARLYVYEVPTRRYIEYNRRGVINRR